MLLQTAPYSTCKLHVPGADQAASTPALFADEQGTITVQLSMSGPTKAITSLVMDCQDENSNSTRQSVQVSTGDVPTSNTFSSTSSLIQSWKSRHAAWPVRQPLAGDPLAKTQDELLQAGYPPRPDPANDPRAYADWLSSVSQPVIIVPSKGVPDPSRSHAHNSSGNPQMDYYSNNWSGYRVTGDPQGYRTVYGRWTVPSIVGYETQYEDAASFWVGIDGSLGDTDCMQAGSQQVSVPLGGVIATVYNAWTEYVPALMVVLSNLPVVPGYHVYTAVTALNNGSTAMFSVYILDSAMNLIAMSTSTKGATAPFHGNSAEWIVERPNYGSSVGLSQFSTVLFTNAYYTNAGGAQYNYNQSGRPGTLDKVTMHTTQDLTYPFPVAGTTDQFDVAWLAFR